MKERILRLCRHLSKFTLDDITTIADDIDESELQVILETLVLENTLIKRDDLYLYNKVRINKLPSFFQFHKKETIDIIIKCFCAEIPVAKIGLITDISRNVANNFSKYFKGLLFEKQKSKLLELYEIEPKIPSIRSYYKRKLYLYNYDGQFYISENAINQNKEEKKYSKEEMRELDIIASRIKRAFKNSLVETAFFETAYEKHWQRSKSYNEKLDEIYRFINIS